MILQLSKRIFFSGTIQTLSGLGIGGSSTDIEIGGVDRVVIRDPATNYPYVPGSSLKGKMRSELEKCHGKMHIKNETNARGELQIKAMPCRCAGCPICLIFGVPAEVKGTPTRLIVRDGHLQNPKVIESYRNIDLPYTAVKTETAIDRIIVAATPRQFEQVPPGAVFGLDFVCNVYNVDDEELLVNKIFEGLLHVQHNYLGGSGSRGWGKVKIAVTSLEVMSQKAYAEGASRVPYTAVPIPAELQPIPA